MTTSGITAWSMTARDLVKAAMQELGLIAPGEEPDASELADSLVRLNGLLKSLAAKGGNLFRESETTVTTVAATAAIALPVGVDDVLGVRLVVSATQERPLQRFERAQYTLLPNKAAVGAPSIYYVEKAIGGLTLKLWPVSATAQTLKVDHSRVAQTVTDASETVDLPDDWQEAVYVNLAVRIAPMFQAAVSPELYARARELENALLDSDRPDSYYFEAGYRY